ncbi:MAG TPA: hypothetical protein VMT34_15150 [Aggregatilineales bacterium]|nr:hypothetical protein [Aggregatilineales bacterium]
MAYNLLLHISNDEPLIVETPKLPEASDTCIVGMHPRRRDNKEVAYVQPEVTTVIFPMWRINFIEVLPSEAEEEIFGVVRE